MTGELDGMTVRALNAADDLVALTDLLHRAYAELADMGLRYVASHQSVETTAKRIARGECYVALLEQRIVGTITLQPPDLASGSAWLDRADVAVFKQFGVEPALKRRGIGAALLDTVEQRALDLGAAEVACDTADDAAHLIALYERRGYRFIEHVDWRPHTNYCSVVLSKRLR